MARKRTPKRSTIEFSGLVATVPSIASIDAQWTARGYERTRGRAYRRKDGTFTVRLVWRKRGEIASAVTFTLEGVALA